MLRDKFTVAGHFKINPDNKCHKLGENVTQIYFKFLFTIAS